MNLSSRGIILGIVVFLLLLLGVFIFSYNYTVRRQNIRAHHEQLGEMVGILALNGVQFISENIGSNLETIFSASMTELLGGPSGKEVKLQPAFCGKLGSEFDFLLQHLDLPDPKPRCSGIEISLQDIAQITPDATPGQLQAGRDPLEKFGEVAISCTVEFAGLRRRAEMTRQFRFVSMVPGIFCRFSLFVPYTPHYFSYNAVGVNCDGTIDTSYHPPSTGAGSFAPLKIINGTDSQPLLYGFTARSPQEDLKRGWIFLGPTPESVGPPGPVLLRIPSGFSNESGGHFLFSKPVLPPGGTKEVINPEIIEDNENFRTAPLSIGGNSLLGGSFQGYFTRDPNLVTPAPEAGAAGWNLWPGLIQPGTTNPSWTPNDRHLCASTWLFPYGDREFPSRTLVVGPVLAGMLKFFFLKEDPFLATSWKGIFTTRPKAAYNPDSGIMFSTSPRLPPSMKYLDFFLKEPTPILYKGFESFRMVFPANFAQATPDPSPDSLGVPFNIFFEFMWYPPAGNPYPNPVNFNPAQLSPPTIGDPYFVPLYNIISKQDVGIPGLHPWGQVNDSLGRNNPFEVRFSPGSDNPDNVYFRGNLLEYRVPTSNLGYRVTNIIDLSACSTIAEEKDLLEKLVFQRVVSSPAFPAGLPTELSGAGTVFAPKKSGIFFIHRRKAGAAGGGGDLEPLPLPGAILLDKSLVLILGKGDLTIPKTIRSPDLDGAPVNLLSLVAWDGNIRIGTTSRIDAYLVALKPRPDSTTPGGRLVSANPGVVDRLDIFGGVAVWELGISRQPNAASTMENFPRGGKIRFNPRFNPAIQRFYASSRKFIMEDKASSIRIIGGEK